VDITKKSFHTSENFFLQDIVTAFPRLAPSSALHSTDYAKVFMALFSLPLLNGYAYGSEGDKFPHLLPAMTTKSGLKL